MNQTLLAEAAFAAMVTAVVVILHSPNHTLSPGKATPWYHAAAGGLRSTSTDNSPGHWIELAQKSGMPYNVDEGRNFVTGSLIDVTVIMDYGQRSATPFTFYNDKAVYEGATAERASERSAEADRYR